MDELIDLMSNVQFLAALLFSIGLAVVIARRNVFFILMGIELLLNAVNLSFIGFSNTLGGGETQILGHVVPLFVIALAAAEACIGLAMVIMLVRQYGSLDAERYAAMKE